MKITKPPKVALNPFATIATTCLDKLTDYLDFFSPIDKKGRYLHFHELKHRINSTLDSSLVWSIVKSARNRQQTHIIKLGEPPANCSFVLTPLIQKAISKTDRNATSASLEWISRKIGEKAQMDYLLKDLIEDESISSSQLEGAATTTRVAKELLKRNRKPRNSDEKMILGNFKMMIFAWENRNKTLSVDLIQQLHQVGVEGIEDEKYTPGRFRNNDDVHVVNSDGDIVHTPPQAQGLESRMQTIVEWANTDHDDMGEMAYLHPLIKSMVLHFCIGYEHPFRDGNGRIARALFYWYLFKSDFAAFRYIAISVLLKKAPVKYGESYLYSETDEMDLTYFIEYQSGIVIRAIEKFKKSYQNAAIEIDQFNSWLWESGLYNKLSDKQRTVFQVAKNGTVIGFTIRSVEKNLGCSYNTASSVLNGLVKLRLFNKVKEGREWVYFIHDRDQIVEAWNS